jgi:hypothetical protein
MEEAPRLELSRVKAQASGYGVGYYAARTHLVDLVHQTSLRRLLLEKEGCEGCVSEVPWLSPLPPRARLEGAKSARFALAGSSYWGPEGCWASEPPLNHAPESQSGCFQEAFLVQRSREAGVHDLMWELAADGGHLWRGPLAIAQAMSLLGLRADEVDLSLEEGKKRARRTEVRLEMPCSVLNRGRENGSFVGSCRGH